ncbi:MAG: hypothetical protein PUF57_00130 [Clostridiaceae bacterium]|nr:hypothetical protein [Clostridiaceae bacterium]MDD6702744.1 hypothetical protein [Clostridiaceae bacterium]MDY5934534.1 hypothetical protein [Oscillospiraceae bacterium]
MTTEEYLRQRIKDLEDNICNSSLPLNFRKNQAFALLNYRDDLKKTLYDNFRRRRSSNDERFEQ